MLLENNLPATHAERIAYERAVDWARRARLNRVPLPDHHVIPHQGGWAIFVEGCDQPVGSFPTQEAAIRKAFQMAQGKPSDVVLHASDGRIIDRSRFA